MTFSCILKQCTVWFTKVGQKLSNILNFIFFCAFCYLLLGQLQFWIFIFPEIAIAAQISSNFEVGKWAKVIAAGEYSVKKT